MKTEFKNVLPFAVISAIMLGSAAFAAPGVPHQFFGSVAINGAPAPDGTTVSAKIGGTVVSSTETTGGKYGYSPDIFYVDDPNQNRIGSTIRFFVNDVDTGATAYYSNGKSTQLDLSVTIASPNSGSNSAGTSGSSTSGSSGGGGGSSSSVINTPADNPVTSNNAGSTNTATTPGGPCEERWTCGEWSACTDGVQKRSCTDANKCGTIDDLPLTSQPCAAGISAADSRQSSQSGIGNMISGMFLSAASPAGAGAILLAIIAIYLVARYSRKNLGKKIPTYGR